MKSSANMKLGQWVNLFIMFKSTPEQSMEISGPMELSFSYFTHGNQFDIWIIFGILKRSYRAWSRGTIWLSTIETSLSPPGLACPKAHPAEIL
jgi:hypothetical protein